MPVHQKYEIADEIIKMTTKYDNLSVDLICATITHESAGTWNPEIKSPAGAKGLMQIMPATGMFVAAYEDISWSSSDIIGRNLFCTSMTSKAGFMLCFSSFASWAKE